MIEFEVKGDLGIQDAGAITAEWMISALAKTGHFELRERVLLAKVIEEQMFQSSGMVDEQTIAAKAGELYGVEAIVTGSVLKWGRIISVTARLIDTQTGTILKAADVKAEDVSEIPTRIDELALILSGQEIRSIIVVEPLPSPSSERVLGTWNWFSGKRVTFRSDGNVYRRNGKIAASWTVDGDVFTVNWRGKIWVDTLRLYDNGTVLRGSNQFGIGIRGVRVK